MLEQGFDRIWLEGPGSSHAPPPHSLAVPSWAGLSFYMVFGLICSIIIAADIYKELYDSDSRLSYGMALWHCFVTSTTVGYGDVSMATPGVRACCRWGRGVRAVALKSPPPSRPDVVGMMFSVRERIREHTRRRASRCGAAQAFAALHILYSVSWLAGLIDKVSDLRKEYALCVKSTVRIPRGTRVARSQALVRSEQATQNEFSRRLQTAQISLCPPAVISPVHQPLHGRSHRR